jgi:hypothetical protein
MLLTKCRESSKKNRKKVGFFKVYSTKQYKLNIGYVFRARICIKLEIKQFGKYIILDQLLMHAIQMNHFMDLFHFGQQNIFEVLRKT